MEDAVAADKIFNFTMELTDQKDNAGNDITGGAVIPEGGDAATVTVPAGQTTATASFGAVEFVKAGTYTFVIRETAEDEEGITYDAGEWTLTVTVRDTDNELAVERVSYVSNDPEAEAETLEAVFNALFFLLSLILSRRLILSLLFCADIQILFHIIGQNLRCFVYYFLLHLLFYGLGLLLYVLRGSLSRRSLCVSFLFSLESRLAYPES